MYRPPLLLLSLLFLLTGTASAQPAPQRIVSMNLCTDQLLLLLVERPRIASLSYFAANPDYSFLATAAAGIPPNRGQAEEVLEHAPDLVLTSAFSATLAASLLERLGQRVERFGFADSLDDINAQLRQLAQLTGNLPEAELQIAALQQSVAAATELLQPLVAGKSAVFFSANGFTYGADTLQHDFMTRLGLRNIAAEAGLNGPAPLALELLIAARPDFVFTDARSTLDAQLAHPLMQHPALVGLGETTHFIELPDRWFQCAGPEVALAWSALATALTGDPARDNGDQDGP